jgi:hypothetical protein
MKNQADIADIHQILAGDYALGFDWAGFIIASLLRHSVTSEASAACVSTFVKDSTALRTALEFEKWIAVRPSRGRHRWQLSGELAQAIEDERARK